MKAQRLGSQRSRLIAPRRGVAPLAAVAAATAFLGCHRSDSILLVEVAGDVTLGPTELDVTVTGDGQTRSFALPARPTTSPIALPASFSVELSPSVTGPVTVSVRALDAGGAVIAAGTATQTYLDVGGQTILTVTLTTGAGATPDAGADAGGSTDAAGGA